MTPLPDRTRLRLAPPARALAASLARFTTFAAWRTLNPATRERFLETEAPAPLSRLYYEADDGWRAPLFHLPAAPGQPGEPVLLAHTLGLSGHAFRYGSGPTLASRLSRAGFSVYLLSHRGDRDAVPPRPRSPVVFDDIVERDVAAALQRVVSHSGYRRVHWVGHGLGGQLGLAWSGRFQCAQLASVVALCSAVTFDSPRSGARRNALAARLLPAHWSLPAQAVAPLLAAWVTEEASVGRRVRPGTSPPPRLRGILHYGLEDLPLGMLREVARWLDHGTLVDRTGLFDYREALADALVPLLVACGEDDQVCPAAHARSALEVWGGSDRAELSLPRGFGHVDALLADEADETVFKPLARWLQQRRRLAWTQDGELRSA